jgi:hypothetical protein
VTFFGIRSWTAFERTIYADILAAALIFLMFAVVWLVTP